MTRHDLAAGDVFARVEDRDRHRSRQPHFVDARSAGCLGRAPDHRRLVPPEQDLKLTTHAQQALHVDVVEQTVGRGRHVQEQLRVAANRGEIEVDQLLDRLHTRVFGGMIEPPRPDRDVGFAGPPDRALWVAVLQHLHDRVATHAGYGNRGGIHRRPVGVAGDAAFIADPPHIRSGIREHHRVRLQPADVRPEPRPVILLTAPVRPFAVGAVEPDFVHGTVLRQQFGQLVAEQVVVPR